MRTVDDLAEVLRIRLASMQVCVPETWTDEQVERFANDEHPTGISSRWEIRREGDEAAEDDPERQPCAERECFVHIVLDC